MKAKAVAIVKHTNFVSAIKFWQAVNNQKLVSSKKKYLTHTVVELDSMDNRLNFLLLCRKYNMKTELLKRN